MTATVQSRTEPQARRLGVGFGFDSLTAVHYAAMGLAAITGAVHLYLYSVEEFVPFLLAGLAFFAAILALTVEVRGFRYYRAILYAGGIPFTAAQGVLWYLQGMPTFEIGVFDKAVQALLVVVLAYLLVREVRAIRADRRDEGDLVEAVPAN